VNQPAVSVCIPAYNASAFVAECVGSVLAQTTDDWELIVADDCSTDDTYDIARSVAAGDARACVTRNARNLGPVGNWNAVVASARGRAVKLLCSDDVLRPGCLAHQLAVLDAHPTVGLVGARRDVIDETGRVVLAAYGLAGLRGLVPGRDAVRAMVRAANTPWGEPSVVMFRAEALRRAGPFSADYATLLDVDMYARVLAHWDAYALDETVASFRVSASSWSNRAHGAQAANARRLLRDIASDPEHSVDRSTLAVGLARASVLSRARHAVFAAARARARWCS
jgi:glycosyltransferase involved in cell wall biosynthesis